MAETAPAPCIYVLAGPNGAGKSSIMGAMLRQMGATYFNPDEVAARIRAANPGRTQGEANVVAWHKGRDLLERAVRERLTFALETTLGGNTIRGLLEDALAQGHEVRVWYVGLASPELHLARVRARAAKGGHDIPEADVRRRFDASRLNLVRLLPKVTELRVFDNSAEADLEADCAPRPVLVLHVDHGAIVGPADFGKTPQWAKPIVAVALKAFGRQHAEELGAVEAGDDLER